jgi:hypothetical protein
MEAKWAQKIQLSPHLFPMSRCVCQIRLHVLLSHASSFTRCVLTVTVYTGFIPSIDINKHLERDWLCSFSVQDKNILLCWQISREKRNGTHQSTILFHQEIICITLGFPFSTSLPFGPCSCQHMCLGDVTLTCCLPRGHADTFPKLFLTPTFFSLLSDDRPCLHSFSGHQGLWKINSCWTKGNWPPILFCHYHFSLDRRSKTRTLQW